MQSMKCREIGRNGRPSILNEAKNATLVQRIKVLIDKKSFRHPNINFIIYSIQFILIDVYMNNESQNFTNPSSIMADSSILKL